MSNSSPFHNSCLSGKVALISGGTSGIGFEIARQLGLHGAKVVVMGRRQDVLDEAVQALRTEKIEAQGVQGDVRSAEKCEESVRSAVAAFSRLDILVNCAAGNFLATAESLSTKGFRTVMEIDALGTFSMSRAAFAELRRSGGGVVINISATLHYGATWYQAHASAAKAAIDSLTRSLALEWGAFGIRVAGVAPGPIGDTAGMSKLVRANSLRSASRYLSGISGRSGTLRWHASTWRAPPEGLSAVKP
uniref:2,4-dienoyl-CoA reductase [(3E)-enoyl-CoA-producing] n=1 Tax=Tetraselmis sp. GSL018 TaxID=582737 RepID=A0A061SLR5_9CHLO